jgi:hypothetical protein
MENVAQHAKHLQKGKQIADVSLPNNSCGHADVQAVPRIPKSSSSVSLAPAITNNLLSQASTIAAKTLGVKPAAAPVKSVQLAQAAAKKVNSFQTLSANETDGQEQDAATRKINLREQAEARRLDAVRKKAEEEKARQAEQDRIVIQEREKGLRMKAELERKRIERDQHMAQALKTQEERLKKEAAAAKAKVSAFLIRVMIVSDITERRG